ncbi:hypothetical protein D5R81_03855 [Parashewanella spongiae]|uniref:Uncharacterized protein n=1 Tax=Parashewanella spongiae TaxID=342950 RepID=A0A3A6UAY1_9GAMM|nr:hypothetical protein [Parashewanella spongiae]MCL1077053.1 hypothetical protein [Parashewanella spongiae]RJY18733.1 hypothetical protein D5R81_03855 [Parashewanella spongiae]
MAFNVVTHDETKEELNPMSFRECWFYFGYLIEHYKARKPHNPHELSLSDLVGRLNDDIYSIVEQSDTKTIYKINNELIKEFEKQDQLAVSELKWLTSQGERFCNWVWCVLKDASQRQPLNKYYRREGLLHRLREYLPRKSFDDNCNNHHDRQQDIIKAFKHSELARKDQLLLTKEIVEFSKDRLEDNRICKMFDKHSYDPQWAWEYVQNASKDAEYLAWRPTSDDEYKAATIAFINMNHTKLIKNSLISGLSRAWSQRLQRQKNEDKSCCNIYLNPAHKSWLDTMVRQDKVRLAEMVEKLIEQEAEMRNLT